MILRPFKFLDSYTREDAGIFFGRDQEIQELYQKATSSNLLLVYGVSGSGKSSLVNAGLGGKFHLGDWCPVNVRRRVDLVEDLGNAVRASATTAIHEDASLTKALHSLYLDVFTPIYLIIDQLEELFILGTVQEQQKFFDTIAEVLTAPESRSAKVILVIREEYLAYLTPFERKIPQLFKTKVWLGRMTRAKAIDAIVKPCCQVGITVDKGFCEKVLDNIEEKKEDEEKQVPAKTEMDREVELTYLQVYLDRAYTYMLDRARQDLITREKLGRPALTDKNADPELRWDGPYRKWKEVDNAREALEWSIDPKNPKHPPPTPEETAHVKTELMSLQKQLASLDVPLAPLKPARRFTLALLEEVGLIGDVLSQFLAQQLRTFKDQVQDAEVVLKAFVSDKGTKKPMTVQEVAKGSGIPAKKVGEIVQKCVDLRLLRDKDDKERYELRHDSLAKSLYERISIEEKAQLKAQRIVELAVAMYDTPSKSLITAENLEYIAFYEKKLSLSEDAITLIKRSRDALEQVARRNELVVKRKRATIIGVAIGTIIVLLGIAIQASAGAKRARADREEMAALNADLNRARHKADSLTLEAKKALYVSELNEKMAKRSDSLRQIQVEKTESEKSRADSSARVAIAKTVEADKERDTAKMETTRAKVAQDTAEAALKRASIAQLRADTQIHVNEAVIMAQNSMQEVDASLRGALALQALSIMRANKQDPRRDDIVAALQGALRANVPPEQIVNDVGVDAFASSDRAGLVRQVLANGSTQDLSFGPNGPNRLGDIPAPTKVDPVGDGVFTTNGLVLLAQEKGGLAVWSTATGTMLGSVKETPHSDRVSSMSAFDPAGPFVSGDRQGRIVIWHLDGKALRASDTLDVGGLILAMDHVPALNAIALVNDTEAIYLLKNDGSVTKTVLPNGAAGPARGAMLVAHPNKAAVFVCTHRGRVFQVDLAGSKNTQLTALSGKVGSMAVGRGGQLLATSTSAGKLWVTDLRDGATTLRFDLDETQPAPRVSFGAEDEIYLGYADRTERLWWTIDAMHERLCAKVGSRKWSESEKAPYPNTKKWEPPCEQP